MYDTNRHVWDSSNEEPIINVNKQTDSQQRFDQVSSTSNFMPFARPSRDRYPFFSKVLPNKSSFLCTFRLICLNSLISSYIWFLEKEDEELEEERKKKIWKNLIVSTNANLRLDVRNCINFSRMSELSYFSFLEYTRSYEFFLLYIIKLQFSVELLRIRRLWWFIGEINSIRIKYAK